LFFRCLASNTKKIKKWRNLLSRLLQKHPKSWTHFCFWKETKPWVWLQSILIFYHLIYFSRVHVISSEVSLVPNCLWKRCVISSEVSLVPNCLWKRCVISSQVSLVPNCLWKRCVISSQVSLVPKQMFRG